MGLETTALAKSLPVFNNLFPEARLQEFWTQAQPKRYQYKMAVWLLPGVIMSAYLRRLPSLDAIIEDYKDLLGVSRKSTLSRMLRNAVFLRLVLKLTGHLQPFWQPQATDLVIIDSMATTISAKRPSDAQKLNKNTRGGGVLLALSLNAPPGTNPVRILKQMRGPWHDSVELRKLDFIIANGPTYVLDRGFFCFDLLRLWLEHNVHFIVRAKLDNVKNARIVSRRTHPKRIGRVSVALDAVVELDPARPIKVRMIKAVLESGEMLVLVTDKFTAKVGQILADYKRRWEIERFHYFLKSTVGMAHLYSFGQAGLEVLAQLAFLLATLLWMQEPELESAEQRLVRRLMKALRAVRRNLTSATAWKRNTTQRRYTKKKKAAKAAPT